MFHVLKNAKIVRYGKISSGPVKSLCLQDQMACKTEKPKWKECDQYL